MTPSLPAKLFFALALALATGSGALADVPDTPAEAFERALSRFAGGDVSGADRALEDASEQGFEVRHPSVDVIRASSGDPASIGRLVRMGWRVNTGGPWLLLAAARGLLEDHPVLAASLASSVTGKTPSGRAAHSFVVRTLHQIGATELASVPGSMLSVMRSSRNSGETLFTQGTVLTTQTLVTDYVVSGQRQLPIIVDRRAR